MIYGRRPVGRVGWGGGALNLFDLLLCGGSDVFLLLLFLWALSPQLSKKYSGETFLKKLLAGSYLPPRGLAGPCGGLAGPCCLAPKAANAQRCAANMETTVGEVFKRVLQ